jgi:hypothetical protein
MGWVVLRPNNFDHTHGELLILDPPLLYQSLSADFYDQVNVPRPNVPIAGVTI